MARTPRVAKKKAAASPERTSPQPSKGAEEFAREIGARIRAGRARRGMTRKMLAKYSETSERYLAQIEAGQGNPSALILREIARALGQEIEDFLPNFHPHSELFRQAVSALRNVPASNLPVVIEQINQAAAKRPKSEKARRIALVGLRGAGKSTLGANLAEALDFPFVELNRLVEQSYGAKVSLLIEMAGQATFRRYERQCLETVIEKHSSLVIATAGGIVAERETYTRLLDTCHVIWIQASPEDHMRRVIAQGDFRPMAHDREAMADLRAILEARWQDYARADVHMSTTGHTVAESTKELLFQVNKLLRGAD